MRVTIPSWEPGVNGILMPDQGILQQQPQLNKMLMPNRINLSFAEMIRQTGQHAE